MRWIFVLLLSPTLAHALYLDLHGFYFSDTLTYSGSATHNRTFVDAAIGIGLGRKQRWVIGWAYSSLSATDTISETSTFTSTDMGLRLGYFLTKSKSFSLFLNYNIDVDSKFQTDSVAAEDWRGTSTKAELGYHYWFSDNSNLCLRLNYYASSLTERITSGTTLENVGYSRNFIYPSIGYMTLF